MKQFAALYRTLDQTNSTNKKVAAMRRYFASAPPADAAWAVYFLSGRRLKRLVGGARLRQWLREGVELPEWLIEESYAYVGDLAETIALLTDSGRTGDVQDETALSEWIETRILLLRDLDEQQRQDTVLAWWRTLAYDDCYLVNKLLTGALRVGVSQSLVARALAQLAGLPNTVIQHRLMGHWQPDAAFYRALLSTEETAFDHSRPYPFCLASPLDHDTEADTLTRELGSAADWHLEWKWDGIRAQLVYREGELFIWTRGEELVSERYPEVLEAAARLPQGTVLDGELLAWDNDNGVLPFAELQKRIGRKTLSASLLREVPVIFMAYDLLEHQSEDIRDWSTAARRETLETLLQDHAPDLRLSGLLCVADWQQAAGWRARSRERCVEGLMLKHKQARYETGRKRGHWWKWKIAPHTVDAVMLYAQPGHGRRANLYTDYTFAVWDGEALVPFAKAYSGLDNSEIDSLDKWIRRNTLERFGPVRSVKPEQVFELAFEGISYSRRHKSGVAVRFPRIARWRQDLGPADADSLADVRALITESRE